MDDGREFTSKALDQWAWQRGVDLHFIRPGKPVENCFVESLNGKFRESASARTGFEALSTLASVYRIGAATTTRSVLTAHWKT